MGKYIINLGKGAKFTRKALGVTGTIGFALWDVGSDLSNGEYYSVGVDIASAIVGFAAGVTIGAFVGLFAIPTVVSGTLILGEV